MSHFQLEHLQDLVPLRDAFLASGFTQSAVAATLGIQNPAQTMDVPLVVLRTEEPTPYNTFVRLFVLEQTVPVDRVRDAIHPMPLEPLIAGHLFKQMDGGLRATVKVMPFNDFYFASDFSCNEKKTALSPDYVLGIGPASVFLSSLTLRHRVNSVFDLGTGAGVQAILAARHSTRVVGSDTNDRALNLGRFNALLNGVAKIEWRNGSFFEPVKNETFDMVVANPPFVISPRSAFLYRDGGMGGDAVSEHVVRGSALRLNEGGYASMLINWHHTRDDDWFERPLKWFDGNGCDSWLLRFSDADPMTYAANWLRQTEAHDAERYGELLKEWINYYQQIGIGRISSGAVVLRKRTGKANRVRFDSMHSPVAGAPCGEHIRRVFEAEDFLEQIIGDDELLEHRFSVHSDVRARQQLAIQNGKWAMESLTLNLAEGLPFGGQADVSILQLLAGCDGTRTFRDAIHPLASSAEEVADLTPKCLAILKKFVRSGIVFPAPLEKSP
jgi:methylase of polypeptide subunit release factors